VARCLALLGMVATHVLEPRAADGAVTAVQGLAGGRASALFAVLAGVAIALVTGRRRPLRGRGRAGAVAGLAVRALLVAALGLALGELDSGIAIILTYYGLLFLLALPFVGLGAGSLFVLAATWMVVAPVVSHLVRPELPDRAFESPHLEQLVDAPTELLWELLLTGYYPVVPWLAYVLLGMAVGRLDLTRPRTAALLAAGGGVLAIVATVVSGVLTSIPSVQRALLTEPPMGDVSADELLRSIAGGMFGSTPPDGAWQWLLVVAPHSGTPFDLAQTSGSALLAIGLCLLLTTSLPQLAQRTVAILFGAGAMTLSLYSLHVVARSREAVDLGLVSQSLSDSYRFHALGLLAIGVVFAGIGLRGPLEALVRWCSRGVARGVSRLGSTS
jgi:MFS family permease